VSENLAVMVQWESPEVFLFISRGSQSFFIPPTVKLECLTSVISDKGFVGSASVSPNPY